MYLLLQFLVVLLQVANLHSVLVEELLQVLNVLLIVQLLKLNQILGQKKAYLDGIDNLLEDLMWVGHVVGDPL